MLKIALIKCLSNFKCLQYGVRMCFHAVLEHLIIEESHIQYVTNTMNFCFTLPQSTGMHTLCVTMPNFMVH